MAAAYTFTLEQVERMKGQESAAKLAQDFGCSDMPIRRYRNKIGWVKEFVLPTPPAPGIVKDGPSEVDMLRDEVRQLRAARKRDVKDEVGEERVLVAIERALQRVDPIMLPDQAKIAWSTADSAAPGAHHRQAAVWSDWHYGETVKGSQMSGLNHYNVAIAEERVDALVDGMLAHRRRSPELTGLDLWIMGDMASGAIHGLEETNEIPAAEQYVRAGYLLGDAVRRLAPHYPQIDCAAVVGNHPRPGKEPASKDAYNNGDWIAYQMAMALTRDLPNVTWEIPQGGMLVRKFAGKTFLLWHGDGVRSSMPGVPWGGIARRVNVLKATYAAQGIHIDYVVVGHFHSRCIVPDVYMNGSLIGPNQYGLKNFGGGEPARQLLLEFDERYGRETCIKNLSFEHLPK